MDDRNIFIKRFKAAVERNFNESVERYDSFEEKHHLFETLTNRLCDLTAIPAPERILDVGCGTGISTVALRKAFPVPPIVYAIDISELMLARARERCKGLENVYFVQGDAEHISSYFKDKFDAVFYTASVFLIPNFAESITQACGLMHPGGVLAISFYAGIYDGRQKDAIAKTFPELKYRYGAVEYPELKKCISGQRAFTTTEIDYHFEVGKEFLEDFLGIPAQSAGLFPKIPYEKRIPMIAEFCDTLTRKVSPLFMRWKFVIARKRK